MQYVLALDQGTTSSRALLFDQEGAVRAVAQREFDQIFPQPGWVEHDPEQIASSQIAVALEAMAQAGAQASDVAAIGIANQRETTIVWNRETGQPIYNAIVWQDRRTADFCERLRSEGHGPLIQQRTGLLIDSYFSASKISWMLDNVPGARTLAEAGKLAFGTVDTWLLWKLTGGRVHATDASNASRTMLFNIHTGAWDHELLDLFRVPISMMPDVRSSSEVYGEASAVKGLEKIPVAGIAGDQQAALFGQRCIRPGLTKNTYGTGCFMLQNTGRRAVPSSNRLVTTVAWKIGDTTEYALEGSVFVGGAVVQWLRDGLGLIRKSEDVEAPGQLRARQRRRLFRSGVRGTGRAALGFLRARLDLRPHARHHRRPPRARRGREHRLSGRRPARRHAPRFRRRRAGTARRRRSRRQRQPHAISVRHSRSAGRSSGRNRNHRARRSLSRRSGSWFLEGEPRRSRTRK